MVLTEFDEDSDKLILSELLADSVTLPLKEVVTDGDNDSVELDDAVHEGLSEIVPLREKLKESETDALVDVDALEEVEALLEPLRDMEMDDVVLVDMVLDLDAQSVLDTLPLNEGVPEIEGLPLTEDDRLELMLPEFVLDVDMELVTVTDEDNDKLHEVLPVWETLDDSDNDGLILIVSVGVKVIEGLKDTVVDAVKELLSETLIDQEVLLLYDPVMDSVVECDSEVVRDVVADADEVLLIDTLLVFDHCSDPLTVALIDKEVETLVDNVVLSDVDKLRLSE